MIRYRAGAGLPILYFVVEKNPPPVYKDAS
jgi:hypothetical protein